MRRGLLFGGWLASLLGVAGVAHANLVLNGGFELNGGAGNQNPSAWINVNPDWNGGMSFAGLTAPESSWFAANGCVGPTCIGNPASNFLDQRLTTTPGAFYNLSFAFNPGANA